MRTTARRARIVPRRFPFALVCAAALAASAAACDEEPERGSTPESPAFAAHTRPRSTVRALPTDTLSDAARIVRLVPEPDGHSVAVLFADSASGVASALAINELGTDRMELLWPDSVTNVWWPSDHSVAFTTRTGDGVRVVVDVHAESLAVIERLDDSLAAPVAPAADERDVRARATSYIDSVYQQANGRATRGELTYAVARVVPQPQGDLVALYVLATAGDGRRSNPAWYLLDRRTQQVTRIDQVVGPPEQLPEEGAGWTRSGLFLYAKGLTIWSAEPTRRGLAWREPPKSLDFNE